MIDSTPYKLFIDDIRYPTKEEYIIARSSKEALSFISIKGCPEFISFDHDLGGEDTSMIFLHRLIEMDIEQDYKFIPDGFSYQIHSANPVGRDNIKGLLDGYLKFRSKFK